MATIQLDPLGGFSGSSPVLHDSSLRRPLFPSIRWGAVWAGVSVGISVQLVLTLLGLASGLSMTQLSTGEGPGNGALVWAGASMLIASLTGAYVAGRMSGLKRKADGMLHGVVSWAVTTLLFVVLATSAGGSLLSGMFAGLGSSNGGVTTLGAMGSGNGVSVILKSQLGISISPQAMSTLQGHIAAGRRDQAIDYMSSTLGVQRDRATSVVDQALIFSGAPEQASAASRNAADRAIQGAGTAAWLAFAAVAISLALSFMGGALGAMGAQRNPWDESGQLVPASVVRVESTRS